MSRFSPQFLDELRGRTTLSTLVGRTVKLARAGREWRSCCPFHHEKTPSFYVNDDKGFYHCFGCSAHGDAIRWQTDQRGLSFVDAVKELADAAGLALPAPDPLAQARDARAADLRDVMKAATDWFEGQLAGEAGGEARAYLARRGITPDSAAIFGLGFAPDRRDGLKAALARFGDAALIEAGLLILVEDKVPYDRFRGRLMIPIRDARGQVIAFGGRTLGTAEPKYLNSPDTPLFDKGRTLYNLDRAAPAARKADRLIVVEGYLDVIALDQAGITEAVAPLGTALTETQIERLWRVVDVPTLCFDGDAPGQKAAKRAVERALPLITPGKSLRIARLSHGQDPDDVLRDGGRSAFDHVVADDEALVDFLWRTLVEAQDLTSPEARAALRRGLDEAAERVGDSFLAREYKAEFKQRFFRHFGFRPAQTRFSKLQVDGVRAAMAGFRAKRNRSVEDCIARAVLLGLCRYSDVLFRDMELVAAYPIGDPHLARWRDILVGAALANPALDEDLIDTILGGHGLSAVEMRDVQRDLAFSFYHRDERRAPVELREVMHVCIAEAEIRDALERAMARYTASQEAIDWDEHRELRLQAESLAEKRRDWAYELKVAA